jgi:Na+/glutamate symporter
MNARQVREAKDSVAMYLAVTVGIFVLGTLVVVFVLALRGVGLPDVWNSLFGLVVSIVSALGGFLAGQAVTEKRYSNGGPEKVV